MEVSAVPVDIDREVWEMGKRQSQIIMRLDALDGSIKRLHQRVDNVSDALKLMNDRDDKQDQRMALVQDAVAELNLTIRDVQDTLSILKRILKGAGVLILVLGTLVGVLGAEMLPLVLKQVLALMGA